MDNNLFGVGTIGKGEHKSSTKGKINKSYSVWRSILVRAHDPKYLKRQPTYRSTTICEEWYNFQNFVEWFNVRYIKGWHLDKDIVCKDCNHYSPETCRFVPQEINNLFTLRKNARGKYPLGVTMRGKGNYRVTMTQDSNQVYIGTYYNVEEAFEAYKESKERYIKLVADRWKTEIDVDVYEAMYNYKIEIGD